MGVVRHHNHSGSLGLVTSRVQELHLSRTLALAVHLGTAGTAAAVDHHFQCSVAALYVVLQPQLHCVGYVKHLIAVTKGVDVPALHEVPGLSNNSSYAYILLVVSGLDGGPCQCGLLVEQ